MHEPYHDDDHDASSEATGLLGADGVGVAPGRTDGWVGWEDFNEIAPWRGPSVLWLLGPYALFTLAFGGSLVPKLNLIIDLVCNKYFGDRAASDPTLIFTPVIPGGENPQCRIPEVQSQVSTFMLVLSVVIGLLSSYTAPKLGSLSDRYGRKHMMAICSAGGVAGEIIIILAAKFPDVIHYKWLILGAVIDGLSGSFTAGSVLSHSYTSDCTPPSKRSVAIGYLHACLFSGLAFGPLVAAYLVEKTGSLLSIFYITLGCHLVFILFVVVVLPESLSKKKQLIAREKHIKEQRMPSEPPVVLAAYGNVPYAHQLDSGLHFLKNLSPFGPLKVLAPPGPGNARLRRNLITLAAIDMVILGAAMSSGQVTILYSQYMFAWGTVESSRFVSLTSTVRFFVLMAIFPVVNYIFRTRPNARKRRESGVPASEKNAGADGLDIWVLRTALVSDVVGITGYVFVRTAPLFVVCGVITAFGGLGSATIQSAITKHVPPQRVGQVLGAIGQLHALSRVFAPLLFNGLYAVTVKKFPQAFFVLLSGIFGIVLLASFLVRPVYMDEDETLTSEPSRSADQRPDYLARQESLEDDELLPGGTGS
ncbi:major facilitator superfamily domain-containing protein [Coniochaeta sp. 2T2.1]|nr:major facilitator superfamily domain-containing protein [Coniochaeta sp. 2T2.1]